MNTFYAFYDVFYRKWVVYQLSKFPGDIKCMRILHLELQHKCESSENPSASLHEKHYYKGLQLLLPNSWPYYMM